MDTALLSWVIARAIKTVAQERHGHRVVLGNKTMSRAEKIRGFHAAAAQAGLSDAARVIDGTTASAYGDSEMADVGRMLAARIAADRKRPTGIVAVNDLLAFGLMAGFREAGLSVPDDVSSVGIDGSFLSVLTSPGLTTVRLPVPAMAETIVECVIGSMADRTIAPAEFLFAPDLVRRGSVASPRAAAKSRTKAKAIA